MYENENIQWNIMMLKLAQSQITDRRNLVM